METCSCQIVEVMAHLNQYGYTTLDEKSRMISFKHSHVMWVSLGRGCAIELALNLPRVWLHTLVIYFRSYFSAHLLEILSLPLELFFLLEHLRVAYPTPLPPLPVSLASTARHASLPATK